MYAQFIGPDIITETEDDTKTGDQPEETKPEETDNNDDLLTADIVRGIEAQVIDRARNHIKITWIPPGINDDFIIARSTVQISNNELLLNADSLAILPAGMPYYIDRAVPVGTYYYSVISRSRIRNDKVKLISNANYTSKPVVIRNTGTVIIDEKTPPQVSLIYSQMIKDDTVMISWKGVQIPGISYVVYRSNQQIKTPELVDSANRIAVINNGAEFYTDNNLPEPGTYYYAVTTRSKEGLEDKQLVPDQSYTRHGIEYRDSTVPIAKSISINLIKNSEASKEDTVKIEFQAAQNNTGNDLDYLVYRSEKPISHLKALNDARLLGEYPEKTGTILDKGLKPGKYWYTIVTRNAANRLSSRFIAGSNTTIKPIEVKSKEKPEETEKTEPETNKPVIINTDKPEKTDRSLFTDLKAYSREKMILLSWKASPKLADDSLSKVLIYRFNEKPESMADLGSGDLIARVSNDIVIYEDVPFSKGAYYYAIFWDTAKGLKPVAFKEGSNMIGPVAFSGASKEVEDETTDTTDDQLIDNDSKVHPESVATDTNDTDDKDKDNKTVEDSGSLYTQQNSELNNALRATFLKGYHYKAIDRIDRYTKSKNANIRAKALYYTGLSYYRVSKYSKALDYFVDPLVMKAYGERANFWYERTVQKIR